MLTVDDTVLVLLGQLHDLVLQERDVGTHVDAPVAVLEHIHVGRDLNTSVGDGTDVLRNHRLGVAGAGGTCRQRVVDIEEQVLVALVEVLDAEVQAVPQATVDTDAPRLSRLPLQVLIGQLRDPVGTLVGILRSVVESHITVVVRSGVVTHLTVVGTQFQVVHPVGILHESLVGDHPVGTHAPEVTPAGILVEPGATVAAERCLHVVAVVVTIAGTSQIRLRVVVHGVVVEVGDVSEVAQVVLSLEHLVGLVTIEVVVLPVVVLMADEGVDAVYAILMAPVQLLLEGIGLVAILLALAATVVTLTVADLCRVVLVLRAVPGVQVALHGECEVIGQDEVGIGRGIHRVAHALLVVGLILPDNVTVGILVAGVYHIAVGVDIRAAVVLAVAVSIEDILAGVDIVQMYGIDRRDVTRIHKEVFEGIVAVAVVGQIVLVRTSYVDTRLEPFLRIDIHHGTGRQAVEAGAILIAVLVEITEREHVVSLLRGTIGTEVVLLAVAVARGLVEPVEVFTVCAFHLGVHHLAVAVEEGIVGLVPDVQPDTVRDQVLRGVSTGRSEVVAQVHLRVAQDLPLGLHPLAGSQAVVLGDTAAVGTLLDVEADVEFALLTFLGGNQDHTVRGTVTIQSCRGSVLQH